MKKGMISITMIVGIILFIVILLSLLFFQSKFFEGADRLTVKETCKKSVQLNSFDASNSLDFAADLNCPVQDITIDSSDNEGAKKEIANAMHDCWDQYGKGEIELFKEDRGLFCAVCHTIEIEGEEKVTGLLEYMGTKRRAGSRQTYSEFLTAGSTTNTDILDIKKNANFETSIIDPKINDKYATIMVYVKGKDALEDYWEKEKAAAPGTAAVVIGFGLMKAGPYVGGLVAATGVGAPVAPIVTGVISGIGGISVVGGLIYGELAYAFAGTEPQWYAETVFRPLDESTLRDLNCQILP